MKPTIHFASDHAGFSLKNELVTYVRDSLGFQVVDHGADAYHENDDFTDFISKAAQAVHEDPDTVKAIILGGSGQGEAMLANRFSNVRAAVYYGYDTEIVRLSRVHNDANTLSLGARFIQSDVAKEAVKLWLATEHESVEKYDRRIDEAESIAEDAQTQLQTDTLIRTLVPSLPASSFEELSKVAALLHGISAGFQLDIVDGVFAPTISWPFSEVEVESEFDRLTDLIAAFELEIDCMCMHAEQYLEQFSELGVARVILHAESTKEYETALAHAKDHQYRIGFAVTNDTSMDIIARYASRFDFIQVMGIDNIGVQGQPFDERTVETVRKLRALYPALEIAVDGGVNEHTILRLLKAGANRFAPGSAITKASDPKIAYKQLASMIGL